MRTVGRMRIIIIDARSVHVIFYLLGKYKSDMYEY